MADRMDPKDLARLAADAAAPLAKLGGCGRSTCRGVSGLVRHAFCRECEALRRAREAEPFCACGRRRSECDGSRAGCSQVDAMLADPPFASTELARLRAELDAAISDYHGAFGDEVEPASERLEQARKAWAAAGGKCALGHPGCDTSHSCAHNTRTDGPCEDCAAETETENAELRAQVERLTRERDEALERMAAVLHAGPKTALSETILRRAFKAEAKAAGLAAALERTRDLLAEVRSVGWTLHEDSPEGGTLNRADGVFKQAADALTDAAPILAAHVEAAVAPVRAERDRHARGAEEYRTQIQGVKSALGLLAGGTGRSLEEEARSLRDERDALAAALVCGATPYEDDPAHRCVYCDDEVTW